MKLRHFDFTKKIFFHPENIVAYKRGERPFPITVEIDPTNRCNHRCSFCFYSEHLQSSRASLGTELVMDRLSEMRLLGTKGISFTGGGEPMLHRDFLKLVRHGKSEGFDIGCITNGSRLTEETFETVGNCLQWIRISMGGGDRESYQLVQGVDHFDRVLSNLLALCAFKTGTRSRLNIGVRILVTPQNLNSLETIARELLSAKGLDYLQLAEDQNTKPGDTFWVSDKTQGAIANCEAVLGKADIPVLASGYVPLQSQLHVPRTCYAHFFQVAITAEGDVAFCKNARGEKRAVIGNINVQSLASIWRGMKTWELESAYSPSTCGLYCKNIALNLVMEETLYPAADMSPNFIS